MSFYPSMGTSAWSPSQYKPAWGAGSNAQAQGDPFDVFGNGGGPAPVVDPFANMSGGGNTTNYTQPTGGLQYANTYGQSSSPTGSNGGGGGHVNSVANSIADMTSQIGKAASNPGYKPNLSTMNQVTAQPIKPAASGLGDIYGKNASAAEAAQLAAFYNQLNFQALGSAGMGMGPATAGMYDPMTNRGGGINPGMLQQASLIDNGQLTGLSSGGGTAGSVGATYSGQPWYVPQLQAGQSLIDTTTGAQTSARQMAQELAIAQENARLQAEAIQNDRYQQELLREKFNFGIDQYNNMPSMASSLLEALGISGGANSGAGAIDTSSPFTQEAAQRRANAARSRSAQSAASAQRQIADSMTGAGFGGSSPAIYSNQLNAALQGAATGASNAEKIFSDYEDKNANFRLAAQVAASEAQDRQARQVLDWLQTQYSLLGQLMG